MQLASRQQSFAQVPVPVHLSSVCQGGSCSSVAWLMGRHLSGCMQNQSIFVGAKTSQTARAQHHVASDNM